MKTLKPSTWLKWRSARRISTIPNWTDTNVTYPIKSNNAFRQRHGLAGKFVVMYSGNLGLTQPLGQVVLAADKLRHREEIQFVLVCRVASKPQLELRVRELGVPNVMFLDYQPRSQLTESLSAADIHLVPLDPAFVRCLMPSKLYGILASGTPVLALTDQQCQLAKNRPRRRSRLSPRSR